MMSSEHFVPSLKMYAAANFSSKLRQDHNAAIQDLQRQLEYVQLNAEADATRVRSRTDAEVSDLKTKIAGLEIDLEKV
jgi:intracellular protein transport protein USO1